MSLLPQNAPLVQLQALGLALLAGWLAAPLGAVDMDGHHGQSCVSCHEVAAARAQPLHLPFMEGRCLACHEDHGSEAAGLLKPGGDSMCLGCHSEIETDAGGALKHPSEAGSCLDCHAPHQSGVRGLLRSEERLQACAACHEEFLDRQGELPHRHRFFDPRGACGNCHHAHQQSENHYLRENISESCLTCHRLPIDQNGRPLENVARRMREAPHVHEAIADAGCAACHTPHGSIQPSLLREGYPAGSYARYETQRYELCWQCHNPDLAERETAATGFRNGGRNLHRVHVIELKRGRACHVCHEAHAADRPFLMRKNTRFGQWLGPLEWQPLEGGGSCQTPCHQAYDYRR